MGKEIKKLMTVSHTDPQSFSTEKTITPSIKARLITADASENAIMFAPPSDQSQYSRVSSSQNQCTRTSFSSKNKIIASKLYLRFTICFSLFELAFFLFKNHVTNTCV